MSVVLRTTEAHVYVSDMKASVAFFTTKLGFAVDFLYGDPPYYGQVQRGEARLAMRRVCEPVFAGDIRARETLLSASFTVGTKRDVEALFAEFSATGVPFFQPLALQPWGALNFIVADLDGNLILFAGPGA